MAVKSFITLDPGVNFIKLFWLNLCHYHHITLSLNSGHTPRGVNYAKKGFMKLATEVNLKKLFYSITDADANMFGYMSLTRFFWMV